MFSEEWRPFSAAIVGGWGAKSNCTLGTRAFFESRAKREGQKKLTTCHTHRISTNQKPPGCLLGISSLPSNTQISRARIAAQSPRRVRSSQGLTPRVERVLWAWPPASDRET